MDRIAEWRPVEPAGPDGTAVTEDPGSDPEETASPAKTRADKAQSGTGSGLLGPVLITLTLVGFAVAGGIGLLVFSSMPKSAVAIDSQATQSALASLGPRASPTTATGAGTLVVDVEGAVPKAGVWRLATGSRVGDAIDAAGGYSPQVDIAAATTQLNLAQVLTDGQQIHVPLLGESSMQQGPASGAPASAAGSGLIDINTATAEQLDTLPGIGPVTAAKIIGARPFDSVEDLAQRGVVGASTLDKIRSLITVGP